MVDDSGQAGAISELPCDVISAGEAVVADYREISDNRELALRVYIAMRAAQESSLSRAVGSDWRKNRPKTAYPVSLAKQLL